MLAMLRNHGWAWEAAYIQPVTMACERRLMFATGTWQRRRGALWDSSKRDDGVRIESCTIVTMPANALMTEIHNVKHRMPAILAKADRDEWLTAAPEDAFKLLRQYPDTHMVATPV
jgi:putative SOS response-associated peptidase YedK